MITPSARRLAWTLATALLVAVPASAQTEGSRRETPADSSAPSVPAVQLRYSSVLDDPHFQTEAQRGLALLYDMDYAGAQAIFGALDARYPESPAGPFLQALVPWWQILADLSDERHDEAFFDAMDEVIDRADERLDRRSTDLDGQFFKGAALGFRARLRANRRDYVRAAIDGKAAMDYVLAVANRNTSRPDFGFGRGVYDYYADALREDHPRFRPALFLFPSGDRARGLEALERTFRSGGLLHAEAAYLLAQLYYVHERNYPEALRYVSWLRQRYPHNAFFHTLEGRVLARSGQRAEADRVFSAVLMAHGRRETGYTTSAAEQALYYLARNAMAEQRHGEALGHLARLEQVARPGTYFRVMGTLRQGMARDARGERVVATGLYRRTLDGPDLGGAHDLARRYLRRPFR